MDNACCVSRFCSRLVGWRWCNLARYVGWSGKSGWHVLCWWHCQQNEEALAHVALSHLGSLGNLGKIQLFCNGRERWPDDTRILPPMWRFSFQCSQVFGQFSLCEPFVLRDRFHGWWAQFRTQRYSWVFCSESFVEFNSSSSAGKYQLVNMRFPLQSWRRYKTDSYWTHVSTGICSISEYALLASTSHSCRIQAAPKWSQMNLDPNLVTLTISWLPFPTNFSKRYLLHRYTAVLLLEHAGTNLHSEPIQSPSFLRK